MPRWTPKQRRDWILSLSDEEIDELLRQHRYRWLPRAVYLARDGEGGRPDLCLLALSHWSDDHSPRRFLHRELRRHWQDDLGDWVIVAMTRRHGIREFEIELLIEAFRDETAHPMTRGSAVYGLSDASYEWKQVSQGLKDKIRQVCAEALVSPIPYARAGAGWLSEKIGGFEAERATLANDRTPTGEGSGLTVADNFGLD